jgi:tRNA/rRNA methyltransferase
LSGTDRTLRDGESSGAAIPVGAPAVILVAPQLGENIGMAARAMLNCGLTDLRLVRPRDGWPSESARSAASGADVVIDGARVFDRTQDALADLTLVFAATARERAMTKTVLNPGEAAQNMLSAPSGARIGVLFGGEAWGLNNDDVALADKVITASLNPGFSSLNLSQAVLLVAWEWRRAALSSSGGGLRIGEDTRPATKAEMQGLYEHLEGALDDSGFLRIREKRPTMVRNLRNLLQRAQLTEQEVRTLRGVISSLVTHKPKPRD